MPFIFAHLFLHLIFFINVSQNSVTLQFALDFSRRNIVVISLSFAVKQFLVFLFIMNSPFPYYEPSIAFISIMYPPLNKADKYTLREFLNLFDFYCFLKNGIPT